jgi:hypothetical protein
MCGNFGLLLLSQSAAAAALTTSTHSKHAKPANGQAGDILDQSLNQSMHQVAQANGIVLASDIEQRNQKKSKEKFAELLPAIKILEAQTAATEIRGGQAGTFSTLPYHVPCILNFLRR